VNAIIDHFIERNPQPSAPEHDPEPHEPAEPGVLPWTQIGDYARVWNIENEELPEFLPLKKLDRWFFAHDMPNPIFPTPLEQAELQTKLPIVLFEIAIGVRPFDGKIGKHEHPGAGTPTNWVDDAPPSPPSQQARATREEPQTQDEQGEVPPRPPGWPDHWMWPPKQTMPNPRDLWDDPRRASRQPLAFMAPWPSPLSEPNKPSNPLDPLGLGPMAIPGVQQLEMLKQLLQRIHDGLVGRPPTPAASDDPDEVEHYGKQGFGRAPTVPGLTPPTPDQLLQGFAQLAALAGLGSSPDPLGSHLQHLKDLRHVLEELVKTHKHKR
jgi:hypothetical protein